MEFLSVKLDRETILPIVLTCVQKLRRSIAALTLVVGTEFLNCTIQSQMHIYKNHIRWFFRFSAYITSWAWACVSNMQLLDSVIVDELICYTNSSSVKIGKTKLEAPFVCPVQDHLVININLNFNSDVRGFYKKENAPCNS